LIELEHPSILAMELMEGAKWSLKAEKMVRRGVPRWPLLFPPVSRVVDSALGGLLAHFNGLRCYGENFFSKEVLCARGPRRRGGVILEAFWPEFMSLAGRLDLT